MKILTLKALVMLPLLTGLSAAADGLLFEGRGSHDRGCPTSQTFPTEFIPVGPAKVQVKLEQETLEILQGSNDLSVLASFTLNHTGQNPALTVFGETAFPKVFLIVRTKLQDRQALENLIAGLAGQMSALFSNQEFDATDMLKKSELRNPCKFIGVSKSEIHLIQVRLSESDGEFDSRVQAAKQLLLSALRGQLAEQEPYAMTSQEAKAGFYLY